MLCTTRIVVSVAAAAVGASAWAQPILLVDEASTPRITLSWPTLEGETVRLERDAEYTNPDDRIWMGRNVECFAAVGGTRLLRGAGHHRGLIVAVGFRKLDASRAFFDDLPDKATIRVELSNIRFNQEDAVPRADTAFQRLQYTVEDIIACGLPPDATELFNTVDPQESLAGSITGENGRLGSLDGRGDNGSMRFVREEDGTYTMTAQIPYGLMRHIGDPWRRTNPGTFFEPFRFEFEYEVVPGNVAAELGVEPPPQRTAEQAAPDEPPAGQAGSG
jgi:hypothetical protein